MSKITFDVRLKLQGPILTKATETGNFGIDASAARNADHKLCIPGTLLKGRLRQACEELNSLGIDAKDEFPVESWFGRVSGNQKKRDETVDPHRGALHFSDFIADEPENNRNGVIHRVRMSKETGTVDKGAYLVMEAPVAPGQEVEFSGQISLVTDRDPEEIKKKVGVGLRWIPSLGGERTVGFGQLTGITIVQRTSQASSMEEKDIRLKSGCKRINITLKPSGPFCLARKKVDGNVYTSEEIISGGVIKGGIATTWGLMLGKGASETVDDGFDPGRKELCRNFSRILITHAFPAEAGNPRPFVAPLSLVKVGERLFDVAMTEKPLLIDNKAPAFDIDWKEFDDVRKMIGWPCISRHMQVRTAMSRSNRSAEKEQLFVYESILPADNRWHAGIDLSSVPEGERQAVADQLQEILSNGLVGWSKTKTVAEAEVSLPHIGNNGEYFSNGGVCVITLQTPAILCNPGKLDERSGRKELQSAYQEALSDISGSSLQLVRFYARQELMGGYYLHQRFQKGKPYHPWLLTTAGSVFILEPTQGMEADAGKCLDEWLAKGLPLPQWAQVEYARDEKPGSHWQNCPYVPENGYGEIAINLACHSKLRPETHECREVADVL